LALLIVLCGVGLVIADEGKGRIEGQVTKDSQRVGAVVVLISELKITQVTDQDGKFTFEAVPVGSYTMIFTLGDNNVVRQAIVTAGKTNKLEQVVDWDVGVHEEVVVTAVARAAKIVDAPAAVTAISEEQIEQEASTGQVPKILEFTPGAEVTQSGLYDFNFNTRGFNSSLNRRVSTYIDGRDVGVVLLGAQEWSAISGGLDDIANLEFVRGPSAALYGANASSGVINITTKAPRDSMGTFLRLTGGQLDTRTVDFRHAGRLGKGWYWKVLGGGKRTGDFTVSRNPDGPDGVPGTEDDLAAPEYSVFCGVGTNKNCLLEERTLFREQDNEIYFGGVRFDKYLNNRSLLTFEAGYSVTKGPVFQTGIGRVQNRDSNRPFLRFNWSNPHWSVLGHYASREGDQANLTRDLIANFALVSDTKRYGAEAQGNWNFMADKLRWVIGAAVTREELDTACNIPFDPFGTTAAECPPGEQTVLLRPIENDRQAIFTQIDWKISDHWKAVFAGRADWNDLHETQFSPKAAFVYSINPQHSIRLTYSEAFQVANYSEFFLNANLRQFLPWGTAVAQICEPFGEEFCGVPATVVVPPDPNPRPAFLPILAVGNRNLALEQTQQWEIGYSGLLFNRAFITVDYYNSKNEDFITDLIPQTGTSLGSCTPDDIDPSDPTLPATDPRTCRVNQDFVPWISTPEAESTTFCDPSNPFCTFQGSVADLLRTTINTQARLGGALLATSLDGRTLPSGVATPVIVARTYANVGEVDTQGVDLGLQVFLTNELNLQGSYSWFDFEVIDENPDFAEFILPNTPEQKASLGISYRDRRFSASLSGRWVEAFRWSAGVFQGDVPSYTTTDLAFSYRVSGLLTVGLNVANLADNVHHQTFGGDLISRRALGYMTFRWEGGGLAGP
jgi:iron complex outermembrane receptor protein